MLVGEIESDPARIRHNKTFIMPCAPLLRFSDCQADTRAEAGEVMSGVLEILDAGSISTFPGKVSPKAQRVFVRVYRTSSEHFAVLYPIRAIVTACRPLSSLNLKSCTVKPLPESNFVVSPRSCDGISVTFRTTESSRMPSWLQAFSEDKEPGLRRKKVSDHRQPMPVLVESEEDETE